MRDGQVDVLGGCTGSGFVWGYRLDWWGRGCVCDLQHYLELKGGDGRSGKRLRQRAYLLTLSFVFILPGKIND